VATNNNISTNLYERKIKKLDMENLDLIIFSIVLVVLFVLLGIGTIAEFSRMGREPYDENKDKGGIMTLKNFIGKILIGTDKKL
jgi:hypothetical protein